MAEPDCCLYFVFQVIRVGCFRCNKGIKCKLRSQPEAGDKAVEGGLPVNRSPGIDVSEETFLLLAGELVRKGVLAFVEDQHSVLHLYILFKLHSELAAASLRVDTAVVKLFMAV